jgi:hypothetical protein
MWINHIQVSPSEGVGMYNKSLVTATATVKFNESPGNETYGLGPLL